MIRMKLEGLTNIESLQFEIPARELTVYHTSGYGSILEALNSLDLDTRFISSDPVEITETHQAHRQERHLLFQVLGINFFFFGLEMLTGFIAGSMGLLADSLDMLADSIV